MDVDASRYDLFLHPVFLLVVALTSARLTRLVTTDSIFDYPRAALSRYRWSETLVNCPWCIGFWISLAVAALLPLLWHVPVIQILAVALSVNYAFAILEARE